MKRYGKQRSSRVAWDEENLSFLDATKTPKRKITEPKTPYHAPDGFVSPFADGDLVGSAEHAQAIWDALSEVATSSGESSSRRAADWASEEDEELGEADDRCTGLGQSGHRLSFAEQRKAHYDEYRKIRTLQKDLLVNEDDEDDGMQKSHEDMMIDGMESIDLHDASTSQISRGHSGKQPGCS